MGGAEVAAGRVPGHRRLPARPPTAVRARRRSSSGLTCGLAARRWIWGLALLLVESVESRWSHWVPSVGAPAMKAQGSEQLGSARSRRP
jgi:hypothetical protein